MVLVVARRVAVAAFPVVFWLSVATLAAAKVPEPIFEALVVSVVAEVANPEILEDAIAALEFISALRMLPSVMPSVFILVSAIISSV
jgi:hypothetical protein